MESLIFVLAIILAGFALAALHIGQQILKTVHAINGQLRYLYSIDKQISYLEETLKHSKNHYIARPIIQEKE